MSWPDHFVLQRRKRRLGASLNTAAEAGLELSSRAHHQGSFPFTKFAARRRGEDRGAKMPEGCRFALER